MDSALIPHPPDSSLIPANGSEIEVLFYDGWIYRYWHYKTGEFSCEIYRQANETEILQSYGLHAEANDLAVDDLKNAARNRTLEVKQ